MVVSQLHSTRDLQTMSLFVPFSICATYLTLSVDVTDPSYANNSAGTFRNVPALLSHLRLCAVRFDGYFHGLSFYALRISGRLRHDNLGYLGWNIF